MSALYRLQPVLLIISIALAWLFPLIALATKVGLWDFRIAFSLIAGCALTAAIVLALAGIGLIGAIKNRNQKAKHRAALVVLILIIPMATLFYHGLKGSQAPMIHDITTDTANPPQFNKVLELRDEGANSLQIDADVIKLQQEHYPAIGSLALSMGKPAAMEKIQSTMLALGWEVLAADEASGIIEASDTSFWFGFVDDVVVRISATESGGVLVDMRSASRVGKSDLGKNAQRIQTFMDALKQP